MRFLWQQIFETVDDPEVPRAATLDSRLHRTASSMASELQRLHGHAFAAPGQLELPIRGLFHARVVRSQMAAARTWVSLILFRPSRVDIAMLPLYY